MTDTSEQFIQNGITHANSVLILAAVAKVPELEIQCYKLQHSVSSSLVNFQSVRNIFKSASLVLTLKGISVMSWHRTIFRFGTFLIMLQQLVL